VPACGAIPGDPAELTRPQATDAGSAAELRSAGESAWRRGAFADAAACWLAEARRAAASASSAAEADALLRAGHALRAAGTLEHARSAFELAAARARAAGDTGAELQALAGLGETDLALGELEAAGQTLDAALERARAADDTGLVASIQNARGNALVRRGRPGEAIAAYAEAERQARAHGDVALAVRSGANGVRAAAQSDAAGRPEGLDARIDALLEEADALPDGQSKARVLIHLGRTLQELAEREREGRRSRRRRAAEAFGTAAQSAAQAGAERSRSFALGYQAQIYAAAGRGPEALELTRRAIYAAEIADAPDALYRWQAQAGRLARAAGQTGAALASYRQAVRTLGRLRSENAFGYGGTRPSFLESARPVYDELVDLLLLRAAFAEDREARQALLVETRDTLEALKAAELRDYFRDECADAQTEASLESIPGTVVVYPIALPDRLELIVGDASGLRRFASAVDRERLEAEVHALRHLLEKRTTNEYRRPARQLYTWLIGPIEPVLEAASVDALVFVPGDALRTIPMSALIDPETGQFLIEQYPVALTPGLTLTEPRRIEREGVELLAAGLSVSRHGFPALEYTQQEIEASHRVFEGQALVDEQFVVSSLRRELEQRQFGIVHIASHGEFASDSADSFLLTYDDRMSMEHLADMVDMTRFRGQPIELLTLSACETAAGDDRAALGLAGVALRAGARSALATLWSVNDEVTAELVSSFYARLGDPERSRAQALQSAQLEVLRRERYAHPGYWSPFMLISSWL
jgi:CHAT domain-containing protein/tetratricopeptide (TPR) repeat protein